MMVPVRYLVRRKMKSAKETRNILYTLSLVHAQAHINFKLQFLFTFDYLRYFYPGKNDALYNGQHFFYCCFCSTIKRWKVLLSAVSTFEVTYNKTSKKLLFILLLETILLVNCLNWISTKQPSMKG